MNQNGTDPAEKKDSGEKPDTQRSESAHKKKPKKEDGAEDNSEDEEKEDSESGDEKEKKERPQKPLYKNPAFVIIVSVVLLILIAGIVVYWLHARHFVSTDDAYVDGHVMQIAPQISAPVLTLHVDDNQLVKKGDLLIELDPTDFQVALEQVQAQLLSSQGRLAQAEAQIASTKAAVAEASARMESTRVILENATRDLERYQSVDERARSRQQLDNATAAQKNARAQVESARAGKASAEANVKTSEATVKAAEGEVRTAEANVKRAQVNLGYCHIYAPAPGRVTQRTVEAGNYVQPGQAMFLLVSPDVWVIANFKETQLRDMRPGQPVTIKVDAFSKQKLNGHVDSIQAGSGSRFGVLPAENATGNFVKIVQRVPVKIVFDYGANTNDAGLLSPGLSVIPKVRVR